MLEIILGRSGLTAIVDQTDAGWVSCFKWRVNKSGYVITEYRPTPNIRKILYLHRLINETPSGFQTDHVNRDRLDNRRANLRRCTASANIMNRRAKSGKRYKGVYPSGKRWRARLRKDGTEHYIGVFDTPEQAALAYNEMARQVFGDFAFLNEVK